MADEGEAPPEAAPDAPLAEEAPRAEEAAPAEAAPDAAEAHAAEAELVAAEAGAVATSDEATSASISFAVSVSGGEGDGVVSASGEAAAVLEEPPVPAEPPMAEPEPPAEGGGAAEAAPPAEEQPSMVEGEAVAAEAAAPMDTIPAPPAAADAASSPPPSAPAADEPPRSSSGAAAAAPAAPPTRPAGPAPVAHTMPDYIIVEMMSQDSVAPRAIKVAIEVAGGKPPFLGGFRNRASGVEFMHAHSQTNRAPKYTEADRKLSRETQTFDGRTRKQQTNREAATQMVRRDVMIDHSGDVWREAGEYETAEQLAERKESSALTIQRYVRGWFACRLAEELRAKREERRAFLEEEEARRVDRAEARRRREIERRMHPRTAEDFEVLYSELEAWRLQETHRIKSAGLDPESKSQALAQLLAKETKLLHTIDRLKTQANKENRTTRVARTLGDMAAPKRWEMCDGSMVVVHTPMTTRANELMQLYNGLQLPLLSTDERLDVLLHVKWTVKEFDCNLTREIAELVDREADLLNRGRSAASLEGLRKRISNLFLQFIETPDFNPEAGRFQVVPGDFEASMRAGPGSLVV